MMHLVARTLLTMTLLVWVQGAFGQSALPQQASAVSFGPDNQTPGTMLGAGGDLVLGIAYQNREGVVGMFEVTQERLFGTDEYLSLQLEGSRITQTLGLSLTDEDFMERPVSRTFRVNAFNVSADEKYGQRFGYSGADMSIAFERQLVAGFMQRIGLGLARNSIDLAAGMPVAVDNHVRVYGQDTDVVYAFGGIDVDRAEPGWMPERGWRVTSNLEVGQARDTGYAKLTVGGEVFQRLVAGTTLRAHAGIGLSAVAGDRDLPLFKTFRGGGIGSVRGFAAGTLGPVSAIPGSTEVAYIGGQSAWSAGLEAAWAVPTFERLKMAAFYDVGGVSGSSTPFDEKRSSVGIGLSWDSPLGPLSVFAAHPLDKRPSDRTEIIQVVYGVRF